MPKKIISAFVLLLVGAAAVSVSTSTVTAAPPPGALTTSFAANQVSSYILPDGFTWLHVVAVGGHGGGGEGGHGAALTVDIPYSSVPVVNWFGLSGRLLAVFVGNDGVASTAFNGNGYLTGG